MRRALLVLVALLALTAQAAGAQTAEPRTTYADVEDEVMCVTCNVALNIAESPQADRQRALIRDLIAQGLTKEQVLAALVDEYGENVLAKPEDDGFGLVAYLGPIAAGAAIVALMLVLLPRWRRRPPPGPPTATAPTLSAADARRLDEDLARYDA